MSSLLSLGGRVLAAASLFVASTFSNSHAQSVAAPNWQWAKKLASVSSYVQTSATEPATGNTYVGGSFISTTTFGNQTFTAFGIDGFIAKHDVQGNILWARQIGGSNSGARVADMALDASGNIYVVGNLSASTNFSPTFVLNPVSTGSNLYVVKYDPSGTVLWARCFGAPANSDGELLGRAVAISPSGLVYIATQLKGQARFDAVQLENQLDAGPALIQLSSTGNVNWARVATVQTPRATSLSSDLVYDLGIDSNESPYFAGSFSGSIRFNSYTLTASANLGSVFLAHYDTQGNLQWATQSATSSSGVASLGALVTDAVGNSYLTGTFTNDYKSKTGISFGPYPLNSQGGEDVFVVKYNATGTPTWARSFGSKNNDRGNALRLAPNGNILLGGGVAGTTTITPELTLVGLNEFDLYAFIISFTEQGNIQWSNQGKGSSLINSITTDRAGNLYVGGQGGYNTVFGNLPSLTINGYGFIARLSSTVLSTHTSRATQSLALYPSPTSGAADIQLSALPKGTVLHLSDGLGRVVCQQVVGLEPAHLTLPGLHAGLYALKATAPNGEYYSGRLLVE
ncbi:SBBP repeat-containing protein [Hymenobacter sp. GOD-10R]|uniref:SBBP repeat-containing protein n=1 Tax=Hymenobacter sp. GOD-10R TaxID=3093922 RepID=UPI002D77BD5E|nr:SBBP repeat-containing protein [Hymenobacter sp. GOD-10R]WRQ28353.1 SBBP repeat-containing protein [Hymenobacter sp. GOD-10R]